MTCTKKIFMVAVLSLSAVAWVGTASAAATPKQKCQQAKLKACGKLERCLMKNAARKVVGKEDKSDECRGRFATALATADAKATVNGFKCRFLDNGDGTIRDLNTGLTWEKKQHRDDFEVWDDPHDADNYYSMSLGAPWEPDGTVYTDFLQALNGGMSLDGAATGGCFAGHCDWRLPTIEELRGILDTTEGYCGGGAFGEPCADPDLGPTNHHQYRSATTVLHDPPQEPSQVFEVNFGTGVPNTHGDKDTNCHVRAVRGGV